ncbi:hypothetical protein HanRHA438_Chr04g0166411 [Helianthus annuus]|nr:hypothetical protein HanHA300_Chr04g0128451 [Helianthus annuus]KAJ0596318.1 hypothetical protein HanHA89_Chr04g0141421 [Helianthus annuus]KAJ0926031.1 hypothetical protein HanRHA438_Chr04g0166411 [Helianthus annuus]KAJ0930519.1 hypothetical protein HanPSC8_Chr04g0150261 [Helianthus annuus]
MSSHFLFHLNIENTPFLIQSNSLESPIPDLSSIPMERTTTTIKIIRKSIHTFLKHYNYFTITSLLALPFSASILISSSSLSPDSISFQNTFHFRLLSLFDSIGIPTSYEYFSIFTLKLSQTLTSSILLLPFTLSFLLITKTYIIQHLHTHNKKPPPFTGIFNSILHTQLWNSFLIISANSTSFCILFIAFNFLETLKVFTSSTLIILLSIIGGITYSIVIANSMIICNMALVLSGMETKGGFISILKACVMIKRRTTTALSLALYINITLAGIEALFQFRVASVYANLRTSNSSPLVVLEGLLIAYLYSIIITLDTITNCMFYKSCILEDSKYFPDQEEGKIHGYCLKVKGEEDELQ